MKAKTLNHIFLILFVFCNVSVLNAQNSKVPPPKKSIDKKPKTIEGAKYYFVFQIDADSKITLSVQNNEDASEFGTLADTDVLTNFLPALNNLGKKLTVSEQKLNSFVIIKADENINYGAFIDFLRKARELSDNQIRIYSSKNSFESFISVRKKPNPKYQEKPNPLTLFAEIKADGKVNLNVAEKGNLADLSILKNDLVQIFKEREENGAFREGTNEVESKVIIKAPTSIKFSEVVKLIKALKEAGAQPIELLIDDLQ